MINNIVWLINPWGTTNRLGGALLFVLAIILYPFSSRVLAQQVITTNYTYDGTTGLVTQKALSGPDGTVVELDQYEYGYQVYATMLDSNMLSEQYEVDKKLDGAGNWSKRRTSWAAYQVGGQDEYLESQDLAYSSAEGSFIASDTYAYDNNGDAISTTDPNGTTTSYEYGFSDSRVVAKVENATPSQLLTADFEDGTDGFSYEGGSADGSGGTSTDYAYTGEQSYKLSLVDPGYVSTHTSNMISVNAGQNYVISTMVMTPDYGTNPITLVVTFYGSSGEISAVTDHSSGLNGPFGWALFSNTVTPPSGATSMDVQFQTDVANPGSAYLDDIRIAPANALVYTYSFNPGTLDLIAATGPNNNPKYFEYDGLQRLTQVSNYDHEAIDRYSYSYSRNTNGDNYNTSDPNFIETTSYRSGSDSTYEATFYDGLGREIQNQILDGDSIIVNNTVSYDDLGRESITYKSYKIAKGSGLNYDGSYASDVNNYYSQLGLSGPFYSQTSYASDPLSRPVDQSFPGSAWGASQHTKQFDYAASSNNWYRSGTVDENGVHSDIYKDILGNTVESVQDSAGKALRTLYYYDMVGNLDSTVDPRNLTTSYIYNTLGQLAQRTSPDAGTVQYLYGLDGRLRLVKDANHSQPYTNTLGVYTPNSLNGSFSVATRGEVVITCYEIPIPSGSSCTFSIEDQSGNALASVTANSQDQVQTSASLMPGTYNYSVTSSGTSGIEYRCTINFSPGAEFMKYDALGRLIREGDVVPPTTFTQANADNQSFPTSGEWVFKTLYYDTPIMSDQQNLDGRLSYYDTWIGSLQLEAVYSYDRMGHTAWIDYYYPSLGDWIKVDYSYDLQGDVTERGVTDQNDPGGALYTFNTYNSAGRLDSVSTSQDPSGASKLTQAVYRYFASGNPQQLTLGSDPAATTIDYHYNPRGWVTNINASQFDENIYYDSTPGFGVAEYNGNVSATTFYESGLEYADLNAQNAATSTIGYGYSYDNTNRLTGADFYYYGHPASQSAASNSWSTDGSYDVSNISYDGNGNLKSLERLEGDVQVLNIMTYNPGVGDQVASITDPAGGSAAYTYDPNGNVSSDSHDGMTFAAYNDQNQPVTVDASGQSINYWYDAFGHRFRKQYGSTDEVYVLGKDGEPVAVYLNGSLEFWNILAGDDIIGRMQP